MQQADFSYGSGGGGGAGEAPALSLSILADRPAVRAAMREDAVLAGMHVRNEHAIADLTGRETLVLGDVVLLDCPYFEAEMLPALLRLDERAARAGAQLVVSTTVDGLDDAFGCFERSNPQILVDPNRADRVIALGRALARVPYKRVRELAAEDRLALLRLTQQVEAIARRLDNAFGSTAGPSGEGVGKGSAFGFRSPAPGYRGPGEDYAMARRCRDAAPRMPEAELIRRLIKQRQARGRFFDTALFADPAWDILLDLSAAYADRQRVSVTSLCIAAGVPATTALRWIAQMVDSGLLRRVQDTSDRRRAFIELSDTSAAAMARYFAEIGVAELAMV